MKKTICTILIACFVLISYRLPIIAQNETSIVKINALSAAVIDAKTGRVLYEKEGDIVRPMASTTKIMTLILALEYGDLESYVTISSYAAKMPDVQLGIKEGEQYKLKDMLYAMILESDNDCAVAVAEHLSGSVEAFAQLMNEKAKDIGLTDTYFITPNGLDAKNDVGIHSTTAIELATLMRYCTDISSAKELFVEFCRMDEYSFCDYTKKRSFTVHNRNTLLKTMEGVVAGKTGFTADAGYCYVCKIEKGEKSFIIALLGSGWPPNKTYKWNDIKQLISTLEPQYEEKTILKPDDFSDVIQVYDGIGLKSVEVEIKDICTYLVSENDEVQIKVNYENIEAPIEKGAMVGTISIYMNGDYIDQIPIIAKNAVSKRRWTDYFFEVLKRFAVQ